MHRQADLLHVVRALHTTRGFASGLDRRKEQTDQNTDNGDDDEKFDEGEPRFAQITPPPLS